MSGGGSGWAFATGMIAGLLVFAVAMLAAAGRYVASDMDRFRAWLDQT